MLCKSFIPITLERKKPATFRGLSITVKFQGVTMFSVKLLTLHKEGKLSCQTNEINQHTEVELQAFVSR